MKFYFLFALLSNPIIKFKDRELLIITPIFLLLPCSMPTLLVYNAAIIEAVGKGHKTR